MTALGPLKFDLKPSGISGTGEPPSEVRKYVCAGTIDKTTVEALAWSGSPAIVATQWGILYRQDIRTVSTGFGIWDVEVPYGPRKNVSGDYSFRFDTTGATLRIFASREHVESYGPLGATGTNIHNGAINVRNGEAEGVEIVVSALKLTVDFRHPQGVVTIPFAKNLSNYTGRYNSDTFLTFDPGELLFLGSTGGDGTTAEAEVSYHFAGKPNESNMTIGNIANIVAKGHDYAWVEYEDDDAAGEAGTRLKYVHVERIYQSLAFATALGNWG